MRATVYLAARRIISVEDIGPIQCELNITSVFAGSKILNTCSLYVSALASTCSGDSGGRVALLPEGSPISAVKSPIKNST